MNVAVPGPVAALRGAAAIAVTTSVVVVLLGWPVEQCEEGRSLHGLSEAVWIACVVSTGTTTLIGAGTIASRRRRRAAGSGGAVAAVLVAWAAMLCAGATLMALCLGSVG